MVVAAVVVVVVAVVVVVVKVVSEGESEGEYEYEYEDSCLGNHLARTRRKGGLSRSIFQLL